MVREREYNGLPGIPVLALLVLVDAALIWLLVQTIRGQNVGGIIVMSLAVLFGVFLVFGLFMVNPNQG